MNAYCQECIDQLLPDNPRVKQGQFPPLCYGCHNWDKSNFDEPQEVKVIERPANVTHIVGRVRYLENKLNEHIDFSKKKDRYL